MESWPCASGPVHEFREFVIGKRIKPPRGWPGSLRLPEYKGIYTYSGAAEQT